MSSIYDYEEAVHCEPTVINAYVDEDGFTIKQWNCENCFNMECDYWNEYNDIDELMHEQQELDEDIFLSEIEGI